MEQYRVRISKDHLRFSAAHFITFDGNVCERLHGHDYRVAVEVHGPLDENHYVVDFIALRATIESILDDLDHHVLLPTEHPMIRVASDREVEVRFQDRRWVFPREDCVLLPLPNTTTEMLARYIGRRLLDELADRFAFRLPLARVEVDECHGQSAICELRSE